jgi:hypothetical protein
VGWVSRTKGGGHHDDERAEPELMTMKGWQKLVSIQQSLSGVRCTVTRSIRSSMRTQSSGPSFLDGKQEAKSWHACLFLSVDVQVSDRQNRVTDVIRDQHFDIAHSRISFILKKNS